MSAGGLYVPDSFVKNSEQNKLFKMAMHAYNYGAAKHSFDDLYLNKPTEWDAFSGDVPKHKPTLAQAKTIKSLSAIPFDKLSKDQKKTLAAAQGADVLGFKVFTSKLVPKDTIMAVQDDFLTMDKIVTVKKDGFAAKMVVTKEMIEDVQFDYKNYLANWQKDFSSFLKYGSANAPVSEEYLEHDMPILYPDLRRVPSGEYLVEVIFMDYKRSANENPMVMAEMEILDEGKHLGTTLKAYFVVRETGLVGWDQFLNACGFDDVKPTDDFNIKTCTGSRLRVYVNDEGWVRSYHKE